MQVLLQVCARSRWSRRGTHFNHLSRIITRHSSSHVTHHHAPRSHLHTPRIITTHASSRITHHLPALPPGSAGAQPTSATTATRSKAHHKRTSSPPYPLFPRVTAPPPPSSSSSSPLHHQPIPPHHPHHPPPNPSSAHPTPSPSPPPLICSTPSELAQLQRRQSPNLAPCNPLDNLACAKKVPAPPPPISRLFVACALHCNLPPSPSHFCFMSFS